MSLGTIVSVGARCPAGLSALQIAMASRAVRFQPRLAAELRDSLGDPVRLGITGGLPETLTGYDRLAALAAPALRDATQGLPRTELPLVLAVPERGRPDDDARLDGALLPELARRAGLALDLDRSLTVRAGHAGGAMAAQQAAALLDAGAPGVIVGGVDSYVHPDVVGWLDEAHRLHRAGAENGIVPSEAAAFFVLHGTASRSDGGPKVLARLTHASAGLEESVVGDEPNLAHTATTLLRAITESVGRAPWALCDVNGERHRMREWSMLTFRELLTDDCVEQRMPEHAGDVGAATAALCAVVATTLWRTACAPAQSCVIVLSSEGPERGVLRLEEAT